MTNLHPVMAAALAPFAPVHSEAQRLAADLAYNQQKNDGTLRRQEDERAAALDFQAEHGGPVPLFGLHKCPSGSAWPLADSTADDANLTPEEFRRAEACWRVCTDAPVEHLERAAAQGKGFVYITVQVHALQAKVAALTAALQAARAIVSADRDSLYEGAVDGNGQMHESDAAAVAKYDLVLRQVDAALAGTEVVG